MSDRMAPLEDSPDDKKQVLKRSTVRIEEDLMGEIRRRAAEEHVSINQMINRVLRAGLVTRSESGPRFRQRVHHMGAARVDLASAGELLAALDDAEFAKKLKKG